MMTTIRIFLGLIFLAVAAVGFFCNRMYLAVAVLALIGSVVVFVSVRRPRMGKSLVLLALLLGVLVLSLLGFLPVRDKIPSYGVSNLPVLRDRPVPAYVQSASLEPADFVIDRVGIEKKHFKELASLQGVEGTATEASRVEDLLNRLPDFEAGDVDVSNLESAHADLEEELREYANLQVLQTRVSELRGFIYDSIDSLGAKPDSALRVFEDDFEFKVRQYPVKSLIGLRETMNERLTDLLATLTSSSLVAKGTSSASLVESEDGWIIEEVILVRSPRGLEITEIDATDLILETKAKGLSQVLRLAYNHTDVDSQTGPVFQVDPLAESFLLLNRITVPVDSSGVYNTPVRPLRIRFVTFRWPEPFPIHLRMRASITALPDVGKHTAYVTVDRETPIERFVLPSHSYYTSDFSFEQSTKGSVDRLTPVKELKPEYFQKHGFVWFELLPKGILSRNPLIQLCRPYLFSENLAVALLVAFLASLFTAVVTPKKE